jgi:Arc/MetJ-type ribon-helix-helix transcriptional regulator
MEAPRPEVDRPGTLLCITAVSQDMSTDTSADDDRMEKINVRVPAELLEQLEEKWERRGYSSKSEAIRDALRSWVNPPVNLSEEILDDLAVSREQRKRGDTVPAEDVRERLGLDEFE